MVSTLVIGYLFLGGAGAGALLTLTVLELRSPEASLPTQASRARAPGRRPYCPQPAYRRFFAPGFQMSCVSLVVSSLCLVFDTGRIDRALLLFTHPSLSYLTLGAFSLVAALLCATVMAVLWSLPALCPPRPLVRAAEALGILSSVVLIGYTGLLFFSIGTGTLLGSVFIPAIFILSSLSCGVALLFLAGGIRGSIGGFASVFHGLIRADTVLLVLEVLALTLLFLLAAGDVHAAGAAEPLLQGSQAPVFWIIIVGSGLLVPLVLENLRALRRSSTIVPLSVLVLVGGLALRWSLIQIGLPANFAGTM
ncbi:MAG: polysulfide reductase NrfD [Coriobacteriales bacterium]|jgi:formate-dependent nitrite reductase membrane component NrfD|nr:polysulfide reductase NrfD [Coriobacteriales bacterium]